MDNLTEAIGKIKNAYLNLAQLNKKQQEELQSLRSLLAEKDNALARAENEKLQLNEQVAKFEELNLAQKNQYEAQISSLKQNLVEMNNANKENVGELVKEIEDCIRLINGNDL